MRTRLVRWTWSLSLAAVLLSPAFVLGQEGAGAAPTPASTPPPVTAASAVPAVPAPASAPAATRASLPRVTEVRSNDPKHPDKAGLGDAVILTVEGLNMTGGGDVCGNLVLFLAEVPIPGSPPEACDPDSGEVRFELDRTAESDRAWHVLLAEPVSFTKKVSVSVGSNGQLAFPTKVNGFELEIVPAVEFVLYLIGLLLSLLAAVLLAKRTTILRDRVPGLPVSQAPYSLSRFQLAFWTLLVIAAYLFIWLITEELDTITGSVLALLGIGSATALGANVIDQGKANNPPAAPAPAAPAVQPPPEAAPLPAAAAPAPVPSQGFLNDVLSDDQGISIYRFQLFAWTLVLGVIFCASVYHGLEMPQFSTTLLGLMGISSGTYLGFKVPEQPSGKGG